MAKNGITNGDDHGDRVKKHPMSAKAITTQDAPAPVGPYNQAVLAGEWLYCSGQIPLDPTTGEMVGNGDVAAHTRAHIAFFIPNLQDEAMGPVLFCGDTLFGAGCGRLFEGTAEQMHEALQKLGSLPDETKVCCAHEYTEANLQWAVEQRPSDAVLAERYREVRRLRAQGELSLPSSIGMERRTNLFMQASSAAELAVLRQDKDQWRLA